MWLCSTENETFLIAHYGTHSNTLLSTSPLSPFAAALPKDPPAYHPLATSVTGIKRRFLTISAGVGDILFRIFIIITHIF